jgi:hypothetical protein
MHSWRSNALFRDQKGIKKNVTNDTWCAKILNREADIYNDADNYDFNSGFPCMDQSAAFTPFFSFLLQEEMITLVYSCINNQFKIKTMQEAYIVAGFRTAVAKSKKGGFRFTRPDDLAIDVIKGLMATVPQLDPKRVDDVIVGNAVPEARACSSGGSSRQKRLV